MFLPSPGTDVDAGARRIRGRARGFTLLELLLVCVLVASLAAIVAPSLSSSNQRSRLDSAARALVALGRGARARASADGRAYFLVVDPSRRELKVARQRDPLVAPDVEGDAEVEGDGWADGAPWARTVELQEGVEVVRAEVGGLLVVAGTLPRIAFAPDGTAEMGYFELVGPGGDLVAVTVDGASGRTRILTSEERDLRNGTSSGSAPR